MAAASVAAGVAPSRPAASRREWIDRGLSVVGNQTKLKLPPPNAERLEQHLRACGVAELQARLVAFVFERGAERVVNGDNMRVLTIAAREAAQLLGCAHRSIGQAAKALERFEWFRQLRGGGTKASTFVLDPPAAAAMPSPLDELDALFDPNEVPADRVCKGVQECAEVCKGVQGCAEVCNPTRALTNSNSNNPCSLPPRVLSPPPAGRSPVGQPSASSSQPPAPLPQLPWAANGGLSGPELRAACQRGDVRLLRHLFEHAARMKWLEASDDNWLRFLQGCHHCATAKLHSRMGRLIAFVKNDKLDVGRMSQRSEEWARRLIAMQTRDPALVALGRSMETVEAY